MPKARKSKKIKAKKKNKSRSKPRAKKPAVPDGRQRQLLLDVIDKMGGSVSIQEGNPDAIVVSQFNKSPFHVDWKAGTISDGTVATMDAQGQAADEGTNVTG